MDVRQGVQHRQASPAADADFFSESTPEERIVDHHDKRQNGEQQDDGSSIFVGSSAIRPSTCKQEAQETSFSTEGPDARNDNSILSCLEHLCRTFSPLGKSIDYVQSDLTSIAKERACVTEEIRRHQIEADTEKRLWEQLLHQESQKLQKARLSLQQERDEIAVLEAQFFQTQARIQLILRGGITHSEEVVTAGFLEQQERTQ